MEQTKRVLSFWELSTRLKMVSAWYMDKSDSDQRDEHKCDPHRPLSLEELKKKTGVLYFPVSDCMAALANNTEMHNVSPPAYSVAGLR